jgi:lipopolysaccharide biosynthesis glycosyltransferase
MKAVYTICTPSHIAEAKTLVTSALNHNPDITAFICLFKGDDYSKAVLADFNIATTIIIEDLGLENYAAMNARYNAFELSCALKPYLADYLLHKKGFKQVIYFDADIFVTAPFTSIWEDLQLKDIILTAHVNGTTIWGKDDIAKKARPELERNMLRGGVYNGGFFALNRTNDTERFLSWWKTVLIEGAYDKPSKGLFTDQLWLVLVPVLFTNSLLASKNPGYNMAYWNLDERKLIGIDGQYQVTTADGTTDKLIFFHFSGYKLQKSTMISVYHVRLYTFEARPELVPLFSTYKSQLELHGYHALKARYIKPKKRFKNLFGLLK